MENYILEMDKITKEFPGVKALDNVCIKVKENEIHAICGENGAGKSTLINILSGVYPYGSYTGEILFQGEKQQFFNIKEAEEKGIVCIHQELALVPELSVGENIFLGNQPNHMGMVKWDELYYETQKLLEKIGLNIRPDIKVKSLGIGQRQMVEILKALSKKAKVLILDEPTSALSENEVNVLLNLLQKIKESGVTCIYISHKLDEVMKIADTVTVLRDGKSIETKDIKDINKNTLISMMVGRDLSNFYPRVEHHRHREIGFEIKNFTVYNPDIPGKKLVDNVSFKAYKGEILGVSGLIGSGRTELFSSIFGAFPAKRTGEIFVEGKLVNIKRPIDAIRNGIFYVPEDRRKCGLVLNMNIKENTTLANLIKVSQRGILDENAEIFYTNKYITYLRTKASNIESKVMNLSGGNQQKVVLGKSLMTEPKVLILDEPTRGIDVGAKYEIYKLMNQLIDEGVIIIMISSELEEILGMSDRILVFHEGNLKGELNINEASQEKIMYLATGGDLK